MTGLHTAVAFSATKFLVGNLKKLMLQLPPIEFLQIAR